MTRGARARFVVLREPLRFRALGAAAWSAAAWLAAAPAGAHDLEVSRSEWTLEGSTVRAHLEVAERSLGDRKLSALVLRETEVAVGGAPCEPTVERAWTEGGDGAAVDARFACPAGAGDVSVNLRWLASLPPGHRHVAHLAVGKAGLTALLTADRPVASLSPPPAPPPPPPKPEPVWPWIALAAGAAGAIGLLSARARKG